MDTYARQVYDGETLIGWVQETRGGRWFARSIETGSTTTEHDTLEAAIMAVEAAAKW